MNQFEWVRDEQGLFSTLFVDGEETEWIFRKNLLGRFHQWQIKVGKQSYLHFQINEEVSEELRDSIEALMQKAAETQAVQD